MKKALYFVFGLITQIVFSQTYLSESFDEGKIPDTWTIKKTNPEENWEISPQQPDGGYSATCMANPNTGEVDEWLITSSFNLKDSQKPLLSVYGNFSPFDAEQGYYNYEILISINNGASWESVWKVDNGYWYWYDWATILMNIDLSKYSGNENVKLAFRYEGLIEDLDGTIWLDSLKVVEDKRIKPTKVNIEFINGSTQDVTVGGIVNLKSTITPTEADQKVIWSITSGSDLAYIWEGDVSTMYPGSITVRATSAEFPDVYEEVKINILKEDRGCDQIYTGNTSVLLGINKSVDQLISNDFTIKANTEYKLNALVLDIAYGRNGEEFPTMDVRIYKDDNGKPGELIKEFTDLEIETPVSGQYQKITIPLPSSYTFDVKDQDTKYWISAQANDYSIPMRWTAYDITDDNLPAFLSKDGGITWTEITNNDNGNKVDSNFELILDCQSLSTSDVNQSNDTKIYPNPVTDILDIDSKLKIKNSQIIDLQGKTIMTFEDQSKLLLNKLPTGIYILKIKTVDDKISTRKFIKK